jgi:geranylgeranyl diphosphate synthase type I
MKLKQAMTEMMPSLEAELRKQIARLDAPRTAALHEMLAYHMGWEAGRAETGGKRIRPLITLLVAGCAGGDWKSALPAAAAVEIVHNFSLVHDDIQDNSPTRRGRPALWTTVGMGMAINAGDALFTIANMAVVDLKKRFEANVVLRGAAILQEACLDLTRGQYLDLAFQKRPGLSVEDYWVMIEGKTAALLGASCQIGALLGGASEPLEKQYREFGRLVGQAFQVQDDILGIWGDEALTGKSAASDLLEGKSSLPVLYAIGRDPGFAERWFAAPIRDDEVPEVAQSLRDSGAFHYAVAQARRLTDQAHAMLRAAKPQGQSAEALMELSEQLLGRVA